jgi:UDP-N-acetylglucosamine acyltransferase
MSIHKTAIISKDAKLGENVFVGPYAVINGNAVIGTGTQIGAHCVIDEFTTIGKDCKIFSGAIIGSVSQDKKFEEKRSFLEIGDNNIIREYTTINRGTEKDSKTVVGNNCLFMAYSHVAHDCKIGNNVVLANCGTLAGYVELGDDVIMGGLAGVHQFVRIGRLSIVGGCSKVVQDIVPYSMSDGHPAKIYTVNVVGLDRAGFTDKQKDVLKRAFKIIFLMKLNIKNALSRIEEELTPTKEIAILIDFIKSAEKGIAR